MAEVKVRAASLPEAMAQVRSEHGASAVITSWSQVGGGVELLVTTREEAAPAASGGVEGEYAAWNAVLKKKSSAPRYDLFAEAAGPAALRIASSGPASAPTSREQTPRAVPFKPAAAAARAKPASTATAARQEPVTPAGTNPLEQLLLHAGGAPDLLGALPTVAGSLRRALVEYLEDRLRFDPLEALPQTPIALVGAPGSGKTVTAAKLAARAVTAGADVLLASCDSGRTGGSDQLQALATRLGVSFAEADSAQTLKTLIDGAWAAGRTVIIDMPGAHPLAPRDIDLVSRLAAAARAEMILCFSGDMRADDAADALDTWSAAGVARAILTRLDLTARPAGTILELGRARPQPVSLSHVADTPFIAGGLAIASPTRLAGSVLGSRDGGAET